MSVGPSYRFAYYCSGHGYGHATRVAAISAVLLSRNHQVSIISSAPKSVFASVLDHPSKRSSYRFAILEPTVVQPKAYDVDRFATFCNLENFLMDERERLIEEEREWLLDHHIECVLIDAPFLPCVAAGEANITSVIISNFTFDSCYSYLSAYDSEAVGKKIDLERLNALVTIAVGDYSRAELLLRLPGSIPIPGFDFDVELPATKWVEDCTSSFTAEIDEKLGRSSRVERSMKKVIDMPLIVRPLSESVYDPQRKLALLGSLGVSSDLLNLETKLLLVSFGGQVIPRPKSAKLIINGLNTHLESTPPSLEPSSLLPSGWIAIVCGLSSAFDMPERFYSITNSAFDYVPDLTAMADVVLGKLGYGTCSEVLATRTPFITVPRKMFVEEYGLKRLMRQHSITHLEMTIEDFEDGRWADYVDAAYQAGHQTKIQFTRAHNPRQSPINNGAEVLVDQLETFLLQKGQSQTS